MENNLTLKMIAPDFLLGHETEIPDDWYFERLRLWRDAQLKLSDWTQVDDAPIDKAAWAVYRQALRDLPAQSSDRSKLIFPSAPNGK
jgi:hypothetical protein